MADGTMLQWIGRSCRDAREAAGRKQVHIAARLDVNQATVARFENGQAWPRDCDEIVNAYADELGLAAVDLWLEAAHRWHDSR